MMTTVFVLEINFYRLPIWTKVWTKSPLTSQLYMVVNCNVSTVMHIGNIKLPVFQMAPVTVSTPTWKKDPLAFRGNI